ncbi:c-type cytochrome [Microbulbifer taiwanensis]|uniref:C-type cytochrome n=2 Tax=Microbulbifer taiwanensis TaxID=986746 RepID=A0ABW1YMP6_9GAMM|nr:c-type cytochrome [Microbulbifer taiwanensis]
MKRKLPAALITAFNAAAITATPLAAQEILDRQEPLPPPIEEMHPVIVPRPLERIPTGEFGDKVRLGYRLFVNSQLLRDRYVGNDLSCVNCHMDAGRRANSAPLWAAYFAYPAYRKKNDKVNSFAERLQGCFTYSTNGEGPPVGGAEAIALSAYAYWLGMGGLMDFYELDGSVPAISDEELVKGGRREDFPMPVALKKALPVDKRAALAGRGYPPLQNPPEAYSPERGQQVYVEHCLLCHGADGQGFASAGVHTLPPLWGPQSYNWGAGMHRINTAASFIYENMPLGKSIQLTQQQAWDVAAYINSRERPQDPRFLGDVEKLRKKYHHHQCYYGQSLDGGEILGSEAFADFPRRGD